MKLKLPFISSFKPGKEGIQQVLGELESEIMDTLWKSKHSVTGRQIYENLKQKKRIAYTTVLTVIDRLVNKGLINRDKNSENTYIYFPAITKEEFKEEVSKRIVKGLMEFAGRGAVTAFVSALESTDKETITELEKLLRERQRLTTRTQKANNKANIIER